MSYAHPGSIQVEVGEINKMIRVNIEQNDIEGVAKFVRLLVGTVEVYQDDEPRLWEQIQEIPPFSWEKDDAQAFEDEMARRGLCLRILRRYNMFGYVGEPAIGNSDALLEAVKGDEEEEEVEA